MLTHKSEYPLPVEATIDHLEAVVGFLTTRVGAALCSAAINGTQDIQDIERSPNVFNSLYTHFKSLQEIFALPRLEASMNGDGATRASAVMWATLTLAATFARWPSHAPANLDDLGEIFNRAKQLGGSSDRAETWDDVLSSQWLERILEERRRRNAQPGLVRGSLA